MVWLLEHKAAVGFIVECSWIGKEHTKNKKSDRKDAVLTLKFRVKKKKKVAINCAHTCYLLYCLRLQQCNLLSSVKIIKQMKLRNCQPNCKCYEGELSNTFVEKKTVFLQRRHVKCQFCLVFAWQCLQWTKSQTH